MHSRSRTYPFFFLAGALIAQFTAAQLVFAQISSGQSGQTASSQSSAQQLSQEQQLLDSLPKANTQISVTVVPDTPGPFTPVTITLTSYATNLDAAQITWSVNGKVAENGIGQKTLSLTTGKLGSPTNVSAKIITAEGATVTESIPLRPESVDVIYEAHTYTPPFYEGRALFTPQSALTIVAVPDMINASGIKLSPGNLIYTWKVDDTVQQSASGYGKDTFAFTGPAVLKSTNITVNVSSTDASINAVGNVALNESQPEIVFYKNDPLYGVEYNDALGADTGGVYNLQNEEVNITAIPYFFSADTANDPRVVYTWQLNGTPITPSGSQQNDLIFRNNQNTQGNSAINLSISDTQSVFQSATSNLTIDFNTVSQASSLF